MTPRKKLIEVSLPLQAINKASAKESRSGEHPSVLSLCWLRRPQAVCRLLCSSPVENEEPTLQPDFGATSAKYKLPALPAQSQEPT